MKSFNTGQSMVLVVLQILVLSSCDGQNFLFSVGNPNVYSHYSNPRRVNASYSMLSIVFLHNVGVFRQTKTKQVFKGAGRYLYLSLCWKDLETDWTEIERDRQSDNRNRTRCDNQKTRETDVLNAALYSSSISKHTHRPTCTNRLSRHSNKAQTTLDHNPKIDVQDIFP